MNVYLKIGIREDNDTSGNTGPDCIMPYAYVIVSIESCALIDR